MCGIVGCAGTRDVAPMLLEGLGRLEYRGYDSAGIAVVQPGGICVNKVAGRIAGLAEKTDGGRAVAGSTGIGHTRWATHGAPTNENAHPHVSNDGRFAVVHNGIIENYLELREELAARGYRFESQTDTEVIVALLETSYDGDFRRAALAASARLRGSYALGIVCADVPDTIIAMREASPLIVGLGAGENYFASDVTALVAHTKNCIYLEDGEFAEITAGAVHVFDACGCAVRKPVTRVAWDVQAAEKGGYEHFMLKEIMEQPAAVRATLAPRVKDGLPCLDELGMTADDLRRVRKVVVTACGSAYYAGCAGRYALERLTGLPVSVELASELRYANPFVDEHTLLVVLSQSGETADTLAALAECRRRGAKALAIVNVVGSTAARQADWTLYTWAGPEIAVATTKGYTTQLVALYLLAVHMGAALGRIDKPEQCRLVAELGRLPRLVQQAIDLNPGLPALALKYGGSPSIFYMGRQADWAVALEGALKAKEVSYVHAEAYAAGELKHGTIALVEEGSPVVALCCDDAVMEKTLSNVVEVKARGAEVLAVAFRDNRAVLTVADDALFVPRVEPLFAPAVAIVPLQLLAYHMAKARGCDIDKPKNLAKSVTVE